MNEKRVWDGLTCIEEQVAYLRRVHEAELETLERHVDGLKERIRRLEEVKNGIRRT